MVAIMIGAVFMGGVAAIIGPALIESGQAGKVQVASTNAQSLLNNVRVWSEGNWNNVLSLSTGTAYQYYLITSSSPYTATSGIQSIVIATNTYTDYFYLNDVYRSGGVIATTSTGNTYDPSTKQVTAVYNWAHGVTGTISTYITRNQDKVFYQADWSGGASSSAVVTSTGNQFGSSTNINYSMTGSISVSTGGGGGGSGQNIWLLDSEYPRGYEFSTAGSSELKFGSSQLSYPQFLAFDPNGNLWISDYNLNQVLEFNASGTYERSIGSTGTSTGMFKMPYGVAFDTGGNMYVADYGNIRIQEFSASGSTYVYKSQFGSSGAGQFTSPMDIAFDPSGNAWVTNGFGDNAEDVEKFVASGTSYVYSTTIGTSGSGAGQFAGPTAIAFDSGGNMWISDTPNNRVQKWIASGTTYVYNAQVGSVGTSTNEFESPWGIAFDSGGNMWVVDAGNARVEEFSSSGAYMTTPINTSGFTNTGFGIVIR